MSEAQTRDVNGGDIVIPLILLGIALFNIGYQIGAARAAQDA
jgi:hypothetical protein